jgi:very-short-patch-repair endonuclease
MSKKKTIEEIQKAFKERGFTLLSTEYKDAHHDLEYICPNGHKGKMRWASFSQGKGCKQCGVIERSKKKANSYEKIKNFFESKGYTLLSTEYKNAHEKLDCICPKGHLCKIRFNDLRYGHGCRECGDKLRSVHQRTEYETIRKGFESEGYTLITKEYKNNKQDLQCKCPKGHEFTTKWNRFSNGLRCPICSSSKGETKIIQILKELNIDFVHDQYIWKGKLLRPDFFLNAFNLVIEFDGIQHFEPVSHFGGEEGFLKRQEKDREKEMYCKENGIDILRIPYWEIDNIEKIIKTKLEII